MGCWGAGGPPARRMGSGKQAEMPMFSVISRNSWEVRLPSAPLWAPKTVFSFTLCVQKEPQRERMNPQRQKRGVAVELQEMV